MNDRLLSALRELRLSGLEGVRTEGAAARTGKQGIARVSSLFR
jgi:hypothetical protein